MDNGLKRLGILEEEKVITYGFAVGKKLYVNICKDC